MQLIFLILSYYIKKFWQKYILSILFTFVLQFKMFLFCFVFVFTIIYAFFLIPIFFSLISVLTQLFVLKRAKYVQKTIIYQYRAIFVSYQPTIIMNSFFAKLYNYVYECIWMFLTLICLQILCMSRQSDRYTYTYTGWIGLCNPLQL